MNISSKEVCVSELIPVRLNDELKLELLHDNEKEVLLKKIDYWSQMGTNKDYGKFWKNFRIEKELKNCNPKIDYGYILKNLYKIRPYHLIYVLGQLKVSLRPIAKYLLIKFGFNPSQYH